ncbi:MAG: hypothetical protein U9O54_03345, partial [Chloroflexota bacterium]|nr:hypothetical protein [Chloroflexota bacterium]
MSCDNNRFHFYNLVAQPGSSLVTTFGSPKEAYDALEQIYQTARSGARTDNAALQIHAEAHTRSLFSQMQAAGIKPPTHSKSGLPKKDAQFGYAAISQTLAAIKRGNSLPGIAREVLNQQKQRRQLSAVDLDAGGHLRCSNCGQFASATKTHICPMTTTADKFNRALQRRMGISENAYQKSDLEGVLEEARNGQVSMTHSLTGESIEVTLDGLPLALATGFSPDSWAQDEMQRIELPDGRVVTVRDPEDFPLVETTGQAVPDTATAYGFSSGDGSIFGNALVVPGLTTHAVQTDSEENLTGGQDYDKGHFMGTEYRKRSAMGETVEAAGETYTIGTRSKDQQDWSSARINGIEPPPRGGVAVGRTLVQAMGILSTGEVVQTRDGLIQVYDADRRSLLAMYDPHTNAAGDTQGNANASAEQMAAVLAHRALHPRTQFDLALSTDIARMQSGVGTPLAAADSAYITMKDSLDDGGTITLGAKLGARRCPRCGQFMGAVHNCPVSSSPAPTAPPPPPRVDFSGLGEEIAEALRAGAPPPVPQQEVTVSLDSEPFAAALRDALNTASPTAARAVEATDMGELRDAMTQMAQAVKTMSERPSAGSFDPAGIEAFAGQVDRLAGAVQDLPISSGATPLVDAGAGKQRCPRCGQFVGPGHVCPPRPLRKVAARPKGLPTTAQEHIFGSLRMQTPDPFLDDVIAEVGGQLYNPLDEYIPELDPNFEVNEQAEHIMRSMSAMLQAGQGTKKGGWTRAFGLYGPAGTGKNTLARQMAASIQTVDEDGNITQGLNYVEANITPESSM